MTVGGEAAAMTSGSTVRPRMIANTSEKCAGTRSIARAAKWGRVMWDRKYDT